MALGSALFGLGCGDDDNEPTAVPTENFTATLNGANERRTPRDTPATATANFILRRDTLYWTIKLTNITNVTASHIHVGDGNTAGGIVLPLQLRQDAAPMTVKIQVSELRMKLGPDPNFESGRRRATGLL